MSNEQDIKAIDELRAMARVYANHGFADKAEQLLKLANAMEARLERSSGHVVNMQEFRAAQEASAEDEASSDA